MADYRDTLLALKQHRAAQEATAIHGELTQHANDHLLAEQNAAQCADEGNFENASWYLDQAEQSRQLAEDAQQKLARVQQSLPQQNALSEGKAWFISTYPEFARKLTSDPAFSQGVTDAHSYLIARGYREDSDAYLQQMKDAAELYGGLDMTQRLTPDEVCGRLGLSANEYNENVVRLAKLKAAGNYRDE